jgi:Cu(I)/Ag(I) efflux system membrane fusion protein
MRRIPFGPLIAVAVMAAAIVCSFVVAGCQKKGDSSAATKTAQETIYTCPMHPTYLSHQPGNCPICGMKLVPAAGSLAQQKEKANGNEVKIDPAMIQSIGVQTEKAAQRILTRDIRTSATVMPDERRKVTITTKIMGYAEKLHVNFTGQHVKKGEPLYDLYSPELVSAQAEYLQAFHSAAGKDASGDAGQMLRSSRQRLLNWDLTEEQIAELEKRGVPEKAIAVLSPASGIVTDKMIVEGQNMEPGMVLYKLTDFSRVWVEGAIYQQDVPLVKIGQGGTVGLDYYPGERFEGKVTYIAPEMNMESKTLIVRLELANTADIRIKPGMNATLTIHSAMNKTAIAVPEQSVIHSGLRTIVVVAKGGGLFEPREIKIGQTAGGYTEVLQGVQEGEDIVVSSQFLIDSESNLKAAVMKMAGKQEN